MTAAHPHAVFELSSSPHGQLVSFEPAAALARLLAALASTRGSCWIEGSDLACLADGLALRFVGAAPFCSSWGATGLPTYLCAFHPDFPDGALAITLDWATAPRP